MSFKKNDVIKIEITDINNLGSGVGRTDDGMVVFVSGAVTGDVVTAKIIKATSSYLVGRLESIDMRSKHRADGEGLRQDTCTAPNSCGGCVYRNIKYEHELKLKRDYVKNAFRKAGLPNVCVLDVAHTGKVAGYRNKAQYPTRLVGGKVRAGFFASKTHDLIPCESCMLQPDVFGKIVRFITDFADRNRISAYDELTGKGVLRHIYIRIAEMTGEIMVCLVINADKMPTADKFAAELVAKFPGVSSVMLNINKKNTNVILGDSFICVRGNDYITDELCGLRFKISAGSFYQVNREGAELLYGLARERAGLTGNETVADLYCGTGTIGLSMARNAGRVVGIEIVDEAVECAKENAKLNGIENAYFFCGDASDTRGLLANAKDSLGDFCPDVVIIDPPRKGTTRELVDYLSELGIPKIVYVSCNPDTLARDCAWFADAGYAIGAVTPVDMFPGTGHVESVVSLTREPTVHNMKLHVAPFEMIKSGEKTIELRLFDEKRRQIKIGDKIVFTNVESGETLNTTVAKLHRFDSFKELYESLPLLQCGYTSENVDKARHTDMEQYYSFQEQEKYGVVGIELC
ncbi:MAG: 23S rRNA (uracil(1939)-C(5))-methyltransferase RlmD [Clostridia bacterium]|nr:23S rRNA (uracil(1939)-C(5))-methyltransferase RlmD [Clostridia bacterium]